MKHLNKKHDDETSKLHKHARERYILLEVSSWEASENYLGVAPIRSGDTVIVKKSGFAEKICQTNWVEPRA